MSCFGWNCRGLGNAATVKELRMFAKDVAPSVLCVLETQIHKSTVEGLKCTLGFDNAFAISSTGRSGDLGIYWNNKTSVQILRSWPNCAKRLKNWPEPRRGSWQFSTKLRSKSKKLKSLA
jgi:exonuclease III